MTYLLVISFLIINATLFINLVIHHDIWVKRNTGVRVNHFKSALYRSIGFIGSCVCLWFISWQAAVAGTFFNAAYFWFLFDGIYNKMRGYNWWQIGTIETDEAGTDNLLRRLTITQHKVLKISLLIISALLLLLTLTPQTE